MGTELNNIIECLIRAKNCDLALNILKEIRQNGLFVKDEEEIKETAWMLKIEKKRWINHMKEKIDEAIALIEN
jgi:pentatricopeptide repeat protein